MYSRLNPNLPVEVENCMIAGAVRYAKHEASDPFALNRALSHIKNGLVGDVENNGNRIGYEAEPFYETIEYVNPVTQEKKTAKLERWRNGRRP